MLILALVAQGEIGYGEFSQLWSGLQGFCSTEARRMFDKFDTDGSGEIDRYAPTNAPLRLIKAVESRPDAIESERLAPAEKPRPGGQIES